MKPKKLPNGKIDSANTLGKEIRHRRQSLGLRQAECAKLCGVGTRFLSELENGKPTASLEKVLQVLHGLGLELQLKQRSWR